MVFQSIIEGVSVIYKKAVNSSEKFEFFFEDGKIESS